MINNGNELISYIDSNILPHGFVRKKDTYYRHTEECICFFHIEKSTFGGRYDNSIGCFLKEINDVKEKYPAYYKCNLKYSLRQLFDKKIVHEAFDLENKMYTNHQREDLLENFIKGAVIFLDDISTKAGISKAMLKYEDLVHYMDGDLYSHLKIKA